MSLKCSIFGHKYTEPDVERERDEQGSEVVITIRELETCERCGDTRVVSENKEVTTLETPDLGDDAAPAGDEATEGPSATGVPDAGAADAGAVEGSVHGEHVDGATDAEILDDEPTADAAGEGADQSVPAADPQPDPQPDATPPPGHGAPTDEQAEPREDVDPGAGADDDGVILEEDGEEGEAEARQPGEWPQDSDDEEEPDWVKETEHTAPRVDESDASFESAGSAVTVPEGEFFCDACGFTTEVESSSLRAGDFCPECQQGTLQHRASGG